MASQPEQTVSARLKQTRLSPRKARLVADQIRNKRAGEALDVLRFSTKKAAAVIHKLLLSAIASAEHNNNMDPDMLYISRILVDEGPIMKRTKVRARGRADQIHKTTSHITLTLAQLGEAS